MLQAGHEALLDGITEPSPDELRSLHDEVLRLARMVDDLQTMAAADAAVLQLTRERHDLADIAGSAADSVARRFETRRSRWTASSPRRQFSPMSGGCTRTALNKACLADWFWPSGIPRAAGTGQAAWSVPPAVSRGRSR